MLPLVIPLSFGSGLAALIYEVVWFQMLELVVGSTAISLGILLGTFMAGMCLGSLLLPRMLPAGSRPLRAYALIETGIGICGIVVLHLVPVAGFLLRGFATAALLLPPTVLMGATLPALARPIGASDRGAGLGFFYGANIAGGVVGCLLAGFYWLRRYDVAAATYAALCVNLAMAGLALAVDRWWRPVARDVPGTERPSAGASDAVVYTAIALSGLCALGAEAIWTRLLGLLLGASVYTFSIVLAVFLTGLGMGSGFGALLCRVLSNPRLGLAWCQWLAAAAIGWTAYNLGAALPYWPINPSLSSNILFNFEVDLARAFWALLPATLLWGASFPLALAAISRKEEAARLMARVYAANTFGAIVGALAASLLLIAWVGSQRAQQLLIILSVAAGMLLVFHRSVTVAALSRMLAGVLAAFSIAIVPPVSKLLIAYGRYAATWVGKGDIIYAGEGMNSSVAVSSFPNGVRTFHVAGKIQASNVPRDMRLQRMLGHLTTLVNVHPGSVLVIGCGAGITAGAISIDPRVERLTIVEIERLVPQAAARYFSGPNFDVLRNPKVQVRIDDGRHYLRTTKERFDGITIDPLDPWVKGAANLYTQEFLETMKQHLNPGGVVTMYIQLFETDPEAVKSSVATFFEVFPNGTIWGNPYEGKGHDMVLLGETEPLRIDLDEMEERIGYREGSRVAESLAEVGMNSPVDLFATYAGRKADLARWLERAPINRDRNLRMQYLAGLGLNLDEAAAIYSGMLAYRRFPEDVFRGSAGRMDSLRRAIARER